jgi:hypothetical protein
MKKLQSSKNVISDQKNCRIFNYFRKYALLIIIFLVSLFIIITFSNPGIFLNDEWITANQLFQLNSGHQVVINEGTYGTYDTGETTEYFIAHGNVLQYTLMLPIISLPVLWLFSIFGDNFRIFVILFWSCIPLFAGLLIGVYYPRYAKIKGVNWIWPAIILSFILFLVNILWYYPFPFTDPHAPREVAAIVFTNHILFALTAVILFQCAILIFSADKWKAIFAAMLVIVNSSFLFWAGNAKDHMLVALLLSLVILFFIRYFLYRNFLDAGLGFIVIGLLTWARPEVGFSVFVLSSVLFLIFNHQHRDNGKWNTNTFLQNSSALLCIIPGILPFLINNYVVTGSLFVPTFYVEKTVQITSTAVTSPTNNVSSVIVGGMIQNTLPQGEGLNILLSFFTFSPIDLLNSLPRVIFWPVSGNMGLFVVCPLAIFAIITLINLLRKKNSSVDSVLVTYLTLMSLAVFLAYIKLIPLMNSDGGIVPDMRYLSPVYIPLGLMGTFSVFLYLKATPIKELLKQYITIAIISVPVLLLLLLIFKPFGGLYRGYSLFFELLTYLVMGLLLIIWLIYRKGLIQFRYLVVGVLVLLAIPFSWQMMMVFLYSAGKFNGYPFWIPIVEQFFNTFVRVS